MKSIRMAWGFCALIFLSATNMALATPGDRVVSYVIYNDPADPDAGMRYRISLAIDCVGAANNELAWEVLSLTVTRFDANGDIDKEWTESLPDVATTDGYWWIAHADDEYPIAEEFVMPPPITGVAAPDGHTGASMDYDFAGTTCSSTCDTGRIVVASLVNVQLQATGDPDPELDEEEEPAETDDDPM